MRFAAALLPESLRHIDPSMLGTVVLDVVLISLAFWVAPKLVDPRALTFTALTGILYVLVFLILASQDGLYSADRKQPVGERSSMLKIIAWTTLISCIGLPSSFTRSKVLEVLVVSLASFGLLCFARLLRNSLRGSYRRNVLVVGEPGLAQDIVDALRHSHCDACVKGFLPEHEFRNQYGAARLRRLAREKCIDEVVIATRDMEIADLVIQAARNNQLDVKVVAAFTTAEPIAFQRVGNLTLLHMHEEPFPDWRLALKRMLDVVLASFSLILLSPLLLLIAAVIKIDSPGPALYKAVRVGQRGHRFICHKFRTMTPQADTEKDNLRSRNERSGPFFKILGDPRITRVGHFLRRYSLDELPQLWNVIRGEMSLVGPRPHPPDDVAGYNIAHLQRLDFVPGITGLWQVSARSDPSFERCVALDVDYIKHWSPWLDLRILCRTFLAVLQGSGA